MFILMFDKQWCLVIPYRMGQMFGMTHTYKLSGISITVIAVVIVVVAAARVAVVTS